MLYQIHEYGRALLAPTTYLAEAGAHLFSEPGSWLAQLPGANSMAAGCELLYRIGKPYDKPEFGIHTVEAHETEVAVLEQMVLARPFCQLQHFRRSSDRDDVNAQLRADPVVLVVAPLSGHHATLLRDTVRTLLADHDVYVTDWLDARMVPLERAPSRWLTTSATCASSCRPLGADRIHVIAVCQPAVPVLAAAALMSSAGEPVPRSLTLIGGPIDSRCSPTRSTTSPPSGR